MILRQRDDGEYQLLSGYRRSRASELAKKQDIPAYVYEMTMQEAIAYRKSVKNNPNAPVPGKFLDPSTDKGKGAEAPAAPGEKPKEDKTPSSTHLIEKKRAFCISGFVILKKRSLIFDFQTF